MRWRNLGAVPSRREVIPQCKTDPNVPRGNHETDHSISDAGAAGPAAASAREDPRLDRDSRVAALM